MFIAVIALLLAGFAQAGLFNFGTMQQDRVMLVEPGKTKELTWTFPNSRDLEFACNIPGHYESGMVGKIKNVPAL